MPISFQCPGCGKKLKAPDGAAGRTSTCPGCGGKVTCPEPVYDAEVVEMTPLESESADPYGDLAEGDAYGVVEPLPAASSSTEGRRPCPMCGEMIVATAAKCRHCGEVFDSTVKTAKGRSGKGSKKKGLRSIAVYQKYMLVCILIEIASYAGMLIATVAGGPTAGGAFLAVRLLGALVLIVAGIAGTVFAFMLAHKLYNLAVAILFLIVGVIPCIGLIALLIVNGRATRTLRDKGHEVGFLGANLSEF
jgi:hypothetical protein